MAQRALVEAKRVQWEYPPRPEAQIPKPGTQKLKPETKI
jgi:hypothetical protein